MPDPAEHHLARIRRADSKAKSARVRAAIDAMVAAGEPLAIAALARKAGVSRRFVYDHPELRAEVDRRADESAERYAASLSAGARVSAASLRADLENAKARNQRLEAELASLRRRLGAEIGEQVLAETGQTAGLAPEQAERIAALEQSLFEAEETLARRGDELEAARQINRELMGRLNRHVP